MKHLFLILLVATTSTLFSCKSKKKLVVNQSQELKSDDYNANKIQEQLPETRVDQTSNGILITFDSAVLFPTNSSVLTAQAKETLKKLTALLKEHDNPKIQIDGHTDATGTANYNLWLSEKRAQVVKDYVASQGVSANLITVKGYGSTKSIATNSTPEGRAKNRRVEVTLLK